ncbi:unnamed protein product [Owenia fusiformis]|uniref:Uncharacterized protein n=1 Tax=Owenia fusiformis TaxID=6347 RepID=A0A8J1U6U9_OWEFU|nr:unnamed protein product [Owenia fusiformis]
MATPKSLFSLEIVVDKLILPNSVCRFPAVAFRLLDFPTLIIYHIEQELADDIRSKITVDRYFEVPQQLNELKDRNGYFVMKKGKTCLFKMAVETLHGHLTNTPLYVMIIDTFPTTPKLIGSCTISLCDIISNIVTDIEHLGLSVPSSHGDKGTFSILNLMGSDIGKITLGYRILSLGASLLPHIPDSAISKQSSQIKDEPADIAQPTSINDAEIAVKTADIVLQDIESAVKPVNIVLSDKDDLKVKPSQSDTSTQTKSSKPLKAESIEVDDNVDDLIIPNIVCPPPLFYNAHAGDAAMKYEKMKAYDRAITKEAIEPPKKAWDDMDIDQSIDDEHSVSDESFASSIETDSIKESGLTLNEFQFNQATQTLTNQPPRSSIKRKTIVKHVPSAEVQHIEVNPQAQQAQHPFPYLSPNLMTQFGNFPVLGALINEIVKLQPGAIPPIYPDTKSLVQPTQHKPLHKHQHHKAKGSTKHDAVPNRTKEHQDQFLSRMARPKMQTMGPKSPVPKTKSWIRTAPVYGVKKTKLQYAMTNTQRMRLMKNNPTLLKTLEAQEKHKQEIQGLEVNFDHLNFSTEISHHSDNVYDEDNHTPGENTRSQTLQAVEEAYRDALSKRDNTLEHTDPSVKPAPVPRKSLAHSQPDHPLPSPRQSKSKSKNPPQVDMLKNVELFSTTEGTLKYQTINTPVNDLDHSDQSNSNHMEPPMSVNKDRIAPGIDSVDYEGELQGSHNRKSSMDYSENLQGDPSRRSSRSIEVHIPSASMNESEYSDTDATDDLTEEGGPTPLGKTKNINNPGFPANDGPSPPHTLESTAATPRYSDEFDADDPEHNNVLGKTKTTAQARVSPPPTRTETPGYSDDFEPDEPQLQRYIPPTDSETEGDETFHSADSNTVKSDTKQDTKAKSNINPPKLSNKSPTPAMRRSTKTDEPVTVSQSFDSNFSEEFKIKQEMWKKRREQFNEHRESANTDSMSSYLPSDVDNMSDISAISGNVPSYRESSVRNIIPANKLGYTT